MKRNIGKIAAGLATSAFLLGAAVVWADDQQNQQSSSTSSQDQSTQAGQSTSSSSGISGQTSTSDQSGQAGASASSQAGISGSASLDAAGAQSEISQAAQDPQQFIKTAYQENLFEVKSGKLGQEKAQGQQVKDFAQSLVQDHQQVVDQLKQMANQKNITLEDQLDSKHQRMLDQLSSLSGDQFDKQFMSQQLRAHRRAVSLFQQASQNNPDSAIKQFAQQTLPSLQHHLQMAQQQGGISEPAGAQGQQGQSDQSQQQGQQGQQDQSQQGQQGQQQGQQGQSPQSGQSNP